MHYYQFNIGNYRRDTTHLTMVEHGAYRQLLDQYYMKEEPISLDMEKVMRTHCARDAVEVSAIEYVLSEYFEKTENGYIHHGCDELIAKYNAKSAMAKKSAQARWNKAGDKKDHDNNANALRPDSEGNANHKPITNNHKPTKDKDLPEKLKFSMPDKFFLNVTNLEYLGQVPDTVARSIIDDFVDYWKIEGSKKTETGWQQAFRRNPIVKKKITNYLHNRGNQNGNEENRKLSAAERASKQVRDFEDHLRQKQANNSESMATDGNMLRASLDE